MLNIISHQGNENQMTYHFIHSKMALIKKIWTITSIGKDMEKLEPSYIAGGTVKWYSSFRKQFGISSKS